MMGGTLAKTERYSIQLATAATAQELRAWLDAALPGETAIYASGFALPREAEGVQLVAAWERSGLVHLKQGRDPHDRRRWLFQVERRASDRSAEPPRRTAEEDFAQIQLRLLLGELRRAALAGLPCPSRRALAEAVTGQTSARAKERVRWLMRRLEAEGRIAITPAPLGAQHGPVVTIMKGRGAGQSTAQIKSQNQGELS